jgi:hypothetical protein
MRSALAIQRDHAKSSSFCVLMESSKQIKTIKINILEHAVSD